MPPEYIMSVRSGGTLAATRAGTGAGASWRPGEGVQANDDFY